MSVSEPKKLALLRIWQILKEYSDENHRMTQEDILKHLSSDYEIHIERKAVGRNISLLKEAGVEIESSRDGSYISERDFDDSELRVLIDGVLCSKYISANHSKDLINRLCCLSNKYFKSSVKHIYSIDDWGKTKNQEVFYNIEIISEAIEKGHRIVYDYNKYSVDKRLEKSSRQTVSPYQMLLHNQRYYLMSYSSYWDKMIFHRVDHMTNISMNEEKVKPLRDIKGYERGIDYKELSMSRPYMYSDKPEHIEFIADIGLVDHVIDWFGTDVDITKLDENNKVKIRLKVSPNAMEHWVMQYINHVEVVSPVSFRERIRTILESGIEKYRK